MFKILALTVLLVAKNPTVFDVVETHDDIMTIESFDGNLWQLEFDGMTDTEKNAEKVMLLNDEIVVIK